MNVYVHLKERFDVERYRRDFARGLEPDLTPYGFHHAEEMGCTVTYPLYRPRSVLQRIVSRILGFDLVHAWRNRRRIAEADVVWTMTETEYLAVVALPYVVPRLRRPKVLAQTIWMFEHWDRIFPARRWLFEKLLERVDLFTVHTKSYVPIIRAIVPDADVRLLPFGISLDTFPLASGSTPAKHDPIRIFAPGTDPTRDWKTFLAAFGNDARFEIIAVSASLPATTINTYSNVCLPRSPNMDDFREYYRWADFVVVPMIENRYSGITVALEAAAMGKPIISSDTGGVPTYFAADEVLYVPSGRPELLRDAALTCNDTERTSMAERATRTFLDRGYSTRQMAARYVELSRELLSRED